MALQIMGLALIVVGLILAFGTMAWFGIRRAFGVEVRELVRQGPYRFSRNPQIVGGYLLVIGALCQWPSFAMVVWLVVYSIIAHWMVITEEEHLLRVFGEEYQEYCAEVPRYILPL